MIRAKNRLQDLLTGSHDQPSPWAARRQQTGQQLAAPAGRERGELADEQRRS